MMIYKKKLLAKETNGDSVTVSPRGWEEITKMSKEGIALDIDTFEKLTFQLKRVADTLEVL